MSLLGRRFLRGPLRRSTLARGPTLHPDPQLTTAVGVQASHQKLTAPGPDDPGSPVNGLFDPNKNTKVAGYIFNEFRFSDVTKAQIAGRIENASLSGTAPAFVPNEFDLNVDPNAIGPAHGASVVR